jgi:hypothetical protein
MKPIITISCFFFIVFQTVYSQQIATVLDDNNFLKLFDEKSNIISSGYVSGMYAGHGYDFFVTVENDNYVRVYDTKFNIISSNYINGEKVTVSCDNIVVHEGKKYRKIFNKNLNQVSSGFY